jgi:hypothetical protein
MATMADSGKRRIVDLPHKLSEIMEEMSKRLFRDPDAVPSSEAAHIALFFANLAWNEAVGLVGERENNAHIWQTFEADNPILWDELKSRDIDGMIDELVEYKKTHFSDDRRRILTCGITQESNIRVEWLPPAASDVDDHHEMQLYGMVRQGQLEKAVRFLRKTRGLSRQEARLAVADIARKMANTVLATKPTNRGQGDYLFDAMTQHWDAVVAAYKQYEDKKPIILYDLHEQRIYVYPMEGFRSELSAKSQATLTRQYQEATASCKMVVFVRDNEAKKLASYSLAVE